MRTPSELSRRQLLALLGAGATSAALIAYAILDGDRDRPPGGVSNGTATPPPNQQGTPTDQQGTPRENVINVRDFGAKGDGKTDDSGAIKAALESASKGDTVLIPKSDKPYLLSFDGTGAEAAIELGTENDYSGVTLAGESPARNAQLLRVEPGSYDPSEVNTIIKLVGDQRFDGFTIRNLAIEGSRPENDRPASTGGEASLIGIHLSSGKTGGGHDIRIENVAIRRTSASAFRFSESGVTCQNVSAYKAGRHGFNPVADDTKVDPGFVGRNVKAIACDGAGIDHRRGTAKFENVYTSYNRSGNKWKHLVERLEVTNHHSKHDLNRGWRSNHSTESDDETPPESQEILFDGVFIEEPRINGIRVSGTDTKIKCDLQRVEVRNTEVQNDRAGITFLRDAETRTQGSGHVVVVNTKHGKGAYIGDKSVLEIDTFDVFNNDEGAYEVHPDGRFSFKRKREMDPGVNIFGTPGSKEVGAFTGEFDQ